MFLIKKGIRKYMKKNNVRIKENITLVDKINAYEDIVSSYFVDGEYDPYYSIVGQETAIITYFIEGIELEDNDLIDECISNDEELQMIIRTVSSSSVMKEVMDMVKDKVDFMKQSIIHSRPNLDTIVEAANIIIDSLDNFSKMDFSIMSQENIELAKNVMTKINDSDVELTQESLAEIIKNATGFEMNDEMKNIIDEKNKEIRELKKYKMLWDSRNVIQEKEDK